MLRGKTLNGGDAAAETLMHGDVHVSQIPPELFKRGRAQERVDWINAKGELAAKKFGNHCSSSWFTKLRWRRGCVNITENVSLSAEKQANSFRSQTRQKTYQGNLRGRVPGDAVDP